MSGSIRSVSTRSREIVPYKQDALLSKDEELELSQLSHSSLLTCILVPLEAAFKVRHSVTPSRRMGVKELHSFLELAIRTMWRCKRARMCGPRER